MTAPKTQLRHEGPRQSGDYRIAVRFGDALLESGHTAIPNAVLNQYAGLGVSPAEMLFVIHVWQFWWTEKDPYPSLGTVAERMGVSRRQVRNHVAGLRRRGLLKVSQRFIDGLGQVSSEYDFRPFLEAVRDADGALQKAGSTPGKDPSGGPRKATSAQEDLVQEDRVKHSRAARARVKREAHPNASGTPTPLLRPNSGIAHSPKPGMSTVADVLNHRIPLRMPGGEPSGRPASRNAPGRFKSGRFTVRTDFLDAAVSELSSAVGDEANLAVNRSRARNLLARSSLDEPGFVALLYHAHSLYKDRVRTASAPVRSGGAYFFSVVLDLLPKPRESQRPQDGPNDGPQVREDERLGGGTKPR